MADLDFIFSCFYDLIPLVPYMVAISLTVGISVFIYLVIRDTVRKFKKW